MKVELEGLTKSYGSVQALRRVSFALPAGEILAVLGANGSGKTTLLRCLSSVAAPSAGTILYDDEPFQRGHIELRRRLMFLPDFPFTFTEMTVVQHIGMVLKVYGADKPDVENTVLSLLKDFDLLLVAERPLGTLSRGQVYKAALVAALAVDPDLWLLDEPFASGMDPHGINAFKRHMHAASERGRTIFFTTQLLEVAERFATRVCVLHQGELRAFQTVAALRESMQGAGGPLEELFRQLRAETA